MSDIDTLSSSITNIVLHCHTHWDIHSHTHTSILDVNVLTHSIILNTQTCYRFIHIHSCCHIKLFLHMSILTLPLTFSHIWIPTIHSLRYSRIHTNRLTYMCMFTHHSVAWVFSEDQLHPGRCVFSYMYISTYSVIHMH